MASALIATGWFWQVMLSGICDNEYADVEGAAPVFFCALLEAVGNCRMIKNISAAATIALVMFATIGCANRQTAQPTDTNPARRTITKEELNKTGAQQTGPALERADPSIQSTGGR